MRAKWMAVIGLGLLACVGVGLLAGQASAKGSQPLDTQKEKLSYAMGVTVAKNIQRQAVDVDVEVLARALRDALSGKKLAMSDDEVGATMKGAMAEVNRKAASARADRKAAGEAFRAENAKKEGVVTLASGLQYKVLEAGKGKTPTDADTVQCHYRGTLIDGGEFDSSHRRGKPAKFDLARASPGWREALKLMPVGSTWQVVIPPELGNPGRGRGRRSKISPNETLVFEIQLLAIEPRQPVEAGEKTVSAQPGSQN